MLLPLDPLTPVALLGVGVIMEHSRSHQCSSESSSSVKVCGRASKDIACPPKHFQTSEGPQVPALGDSIGNVADLGREGIGMN